MEIRSNVIIAVRKFIGFLSTKMTRRRPKDAQPVSWPIRISDSQQLKDKMIPGKSDIPERVNTRDEYEQRDQLSPVVAFLQNPWFAPSVSEKIIKRYKEDPDFRRIVLGRSKTGVWLKNAFGPEAYKIIWWDNASKNAGRHRAALYPADLEHMREVIAKVGPDLVIAFGRIAGQAIDQVWPGPTLKCPHPMARGDQRDNLLSTAKETKKFLKGYGYDV